MTPRDWRRLSLRALGVEAQPGFACGEHNSKEVGIVHLRPMNVSRLGVLDMSDCRWVEDASHRRVEDGDVLFNNTNSPALVGKTAAVKGGPYAYSNHMTRLRVDGDVLDPAFLAMQLHTLWTQGVFERLCSNHVNQASVATRRLLEVEVSVPPLDEQRRLVEILEDHMSRLDAANALLTTLEPRVVSLRTRIVDSAMALVRPRMTGEPDVLARLHDERTKRAANGRTRSPAPPDLDLGEPPTPWPVASLEEVTDPLRIIRYGILMPRVKSGGSVPYVEVKDLKGNTLSGKRLHETSPDLDEKFAGARLAGGDVVIAVRGSYERSAVVPADLAGSNISRDVARLAPLPSLLPNFLHAWLQSSYSNRYLHSHARGVAVKGVNIATLRAMPVPVPSIAAQTEIVTEVDARWTALAAGLDASLVCKERSERLRQGLLIAAMRGDFTRGDRR
jgi:type I restriction enzyme S subunit